MSRCQFCGSDLYTGHSCPETGGAGSFLSSPTGAVAPVTFIVCPVCAEKDAEIARLREALTETLNLAIVADEGDYFYAEQAGIDSAAVIAKARAALGKEGT